MSLTAFVIIEVIHFQERLIELNLIVNLLLIINRLIRISHVVLLLLLILFFVKDVHA